MLNAYAISRLSDLSWGNRPEIEISKLRGGPRKRRADGEGDMDIPVTVVCSQPGCQEHALEGKLIQSRWNRFMCNAAYEHYQSGLCAEHEWLKMATWRCHALNLGLVISNCTAVFVFSEVSPLWLLIVNSLHVVYQLIIISHAVFIKLIIIGFFNTFRLKVIRVITTGRLTELYPVCRL